MTKYRLKKNRPAFEAVDGPLAGRKYTHGVVYTEIPEGSGKHFVCTGGTGGFVRAGLKPAPTAPTAPTKQTKIQKGHKK